MEVVHAIKDLMAGRLRAWQAVLHAMCGVTEYEELPVRHNEDVLNMRLSTEVGSLGLPCMRHKGWHEGVQNTERPGTSPRCTSSRCLTTNFS